MTLPAFSTAKLIGLGIGVLALVALVAMVNGWRVERNELRAWQAEAVSATREAAANPKLGVALVPQQIRLLGTAHKQCKAALASQSAAVDQLAARTAELEGLAAAADRRSVKRVERVDETRAGLLASSRSSAAQARPCDPSEALKGAWR